MATTAKQVPITFNLPVTANGTTQDVTSAGFGTPKAALFITNGGNGAEDTYTSAARMSYGMLDDTGTMLCTSTIQRGPVTNMDGSRGAYDDRIADVLSSSDNTSSVGSFSAEVITDGVRITVLDDTASGYTCTVILFGGADLVNAKVVNAVLDASSTAPQSTVVGFQPNSLIWIGANRSYDVNGSSGTSFMAFGAVDAALVQKSSAYTSQRGTGTSSTVAGMRSTATHYVSTAGVLSQAYSVTGYTPTGFDGEFLVAGSTAGKQYGVLALEIANSSPTMELTSIPSAGSWTVSGLPYRPGLAIANTVDVITAAAQTATSSVYSYGLHVFNSDGIASQAVFDRDSVGTSVNGNYYSQQLRNPRFVGTALSYDGPPPTITADGWTSALTTHPAASLYAWALTFEEPTATGGVKQMYVRSGGAWVPYTPNVNVGGTFQEVDAYVNVGGVWTPVHEK